MLRLLLITALFVILPLTVQGIRYPNQFFQLVSENGNCLQLWDDHGTFVPCKDEDVNGHGFIMSANTVFLVNDDRPGHFKIQLFGKSECLDRKHCHSSTSTLRYSDCGECGAVHWSINTFDGSVREDSDNNCIYCDEDGEARVRHCTDGFERFTVNYLGDRFQLKSKTHGDCVAGENFTNCNDAPTFFTRDSPGKYKIHVYEDPDKCLDRKHCHSSTSSVRLHDCSHCGADDWSVDFPCTVWQDDNKNYVNRGDKHNATKMYHCSDGHEQLYFVIIPNEPTIVDDITEYNPTVVQPLEFPAPDPNQYLQRNLSLGIRGVKIFRSRSSNTFEIEIVHFLPVATRSGNFNREYMVTHIHTNIRYQEDLSILFVMESIAADITQIAQYNIRYGMVDTNHQRATNFHGLFSQFVTNSQGVPVTRFTQATIDELQRGIRNNVAPSGTPQYFESFYDGQFEPRQWYLDFNTFTNNVLYWPSDFYQNNPFNQQVTRKNKEKNTEL